MKTVVSKNQGIMNTLAAAVRYLLIIAGAVPLLLNLLGSGNFVAIVTYFQSDEGAGLVAAVGALVTLGIGLFRTFKHGNKLVEVAADPQNKNVVLKP